MYDLASTLMGKFASFDLIILGILVGLGVKSWGQLIIGSFMAAVVSEWVVSAMMPVPKEWSTQAFVMGIVAAFVWGTVAFIIRQGAVARRT